MNTIRIEESLEFDAAPEQVYAVLSDYERAHPSILPKQYFKRLTILEGGHGAGTVFEVVMSVMGLRQTYRMAVSEPQPGRILQESDEEAGVYTQFVVDRLQGEPRCRLTISSEMTSSRGLRGWLKRFVQPMVIRRIYRAELQLVADYLAEYGEH